MVEGSGEAPPPGQATVRAHYAGYLPSGALFDTSYRPARPPPDRAPRGARAPARSRQG